MMHDKYLRDNGWFKLTDGWCHLNCYYSVCEEVALLVQRKRDEYNYLPWYRKLIKKLFE